MTDWLPWSYVVVVTGTALWFLRWSRDPKGTPQAPYRIVIVILLWSGLWQAVIALGGGHTEVAGRPVDWAQYLDWLVSTPLLAIALMLTGTHAVPDKPRRLVPTMVAASTVMILCGMVADFMPDRTARFTVYGIGVLPLLLLLGLIWGPLRATALRQPRSMASLYVALALLLTGLWIGFPLVWLLGPSGLEMIAEPTGAALFVALSVLMKVVWSLVDIGRLRALAARGEFSVE